MPNVWAEELRVFLRENEQKIAGGEFALATTFRHVIGRQAQIPGLPATPPATPKAEPSTRDEDSGLARAAASVPQG